MVDVANVSGVDTVLKSTPVCRFAHGQSIPQPGRGNAHGLSSRTSDPCGRKSIVFCGERSNTPPELKGVGVTLWCPPAAVTAGPATTCPVEPRRHDHTDSCWTSARHCEATVLPSRRFCMQDLQRRLAVQQRNRSLSEASGDASSVTHASVLRHEDRTTPVASGRWHPLVVDLLLEQ